MSKSYQWYYDGSAIGGATGKTHTLTSGQTDSNLIECRTEVTYGTDSVAALAEYAAPGGSFAGVTPSSTGLYVTGGLASTTLSQSFAIENATDTVVFAAVTTRFSNKSPSSPTIGGVSATLLAAVESSAASVYIYYATVSNVSTATVEVTASVNWDQVSCFVWHARNAVPGTAVTSTAGADPGTVSVTCTAGSSVIMAAMANNGASGGVMGTTIGVTEDYNNEGTMGSDDGPIGGHVDGVAAGADDYGVNWSATPGNSAIVAFEVSEAP